jgi:PDZ domain-containing protein
VLTLAILGLHIPYFALTPGPAVDVSQLIAVQGVKTSPVKGKLMLTTVSLVPGIRVFERLIWLGDSSVAIVSRSAFIQPGQSEQDVQQQTADQMRESQVSAAASALQLLGYHVDIKYSGIRVLAVRSDAPASSVLHAGDKISDVDGSPVKHPVDLVKAIHKHPVGSSVRLRVVRGANTFTASVRTIGRPTNKRDPVIGVIIDSLPQVKLPVAVSINAQGIGGPSAGLMFALGIVQTVGHTNLAKGRAIAGTGEIGLDGVVGPVGGIEQKIEGARRAHAQLFLAPLEELREACRAAHGLKVVGVGNLKEAVRALKGERLPAGRQCP